MLDREDCARLDALYERMRDANAVSLGYPSAKDFDYDGLDRFMRFPVNNVGDPFAESTYRVETREFEREVVEFFASLFRAPRDDWWGYVTNGGTEGNLYGLYLARELLPGGMVYYSEQTHYSVAKNLHFLNMRHITIRSQASGEIDYEDLRETLKIHRDVPPIIFANIGTTMTEARDDVRRIIEIMGSLAIRKRYVHSDAALSGGYAGFLEPRPHYDFEDGADSVAVSGHKFLGAPIPCGVVIARKQNVQRIARAIDYIGSLDTTISGSRNGITPLMLWYRLRELGPGGIRARVQHSLDLAAYLETRLREAGIAAWRNPNAITVVFPRASETMRAKWQLATAGAISHAIVLPNVTREQVDTFVADMIDDHAAKEQSCEISG
ncbi:MAG TPA: histidine decarboxylase [Candidatus Baltobacteraceae bacterium]|jgi:histidine decarboxylase|nr:histidine decarboxylase [Candidatus Baltobacteraceae bacterium]